MSKLTPMKGNWETEAAWQGHIMHGTTVNCAASSRIRGADLKYLTIAMRPIVFTTWVHYKEDIVSCFRRS